jgi:hypothetical protein
VTLLNVAVSHAHERLGQCAGPAVPPLYVEVVTKDVVSLEVTIPVSVSSDQFQPPELLIGCSWAITF